MQGEICPREVITLAEQRFPELAGERVREAVAVVESGRVAPFPKVGERPPRDLGLGEIDRHHLDAGGFDQQIEQPHPVCPWRDSRTIEASRKEAADVRRTAAAAIALVNEGRSGSSCRIARKADVSMTISGEGRARHTREYRQRAVHHALGAARTGARARRPAFGQTVLVEVVPDGAEWRR